MNYKKALSVALIFLVSAVLAASKPQLEHFTSPAEELSDFVPSSAQLIRHGAYVLSYDGKTRNTHWVYERLTAASLAGDVERSHFDFMEDPLIPSSHRATKDDYKGAGFDRGHLCPAADARASSDMMRDTFYLSNISPQNPQLNRKLWLKLEKHARGLTKMFDVVEVISGPLYLPEQDKDGKKYVKYQVIGSNDVAVPTHFFKVIRCLKGASEKIEAFILPNESLQNERSLEEFMVSVEKVERAAGIVFRKQ